MFQFRTFPMAVLSLGVLACSPAPVGHPMTAQTTMHTASHWQALAADTAKRITGLRDSAITEAARMAEITGELFTEPDFALADNVSFYVDSVAFD